MPIKRSDLRFDAHALQQMMARNISPDEVLQVMNEGVLIDRPRPPRMRLVAELPIRHGIVRVVWTIEGKKLLVITAMWKE